MLRAIKYFLSLSVGGLLVLLGTLGIVTGAQGSIPMVGLFFITSFGYLILAYIPSDIAWRKGHSDLKWLLYGFLIWPVALIHSLMISDYEHDFKTCPFCAERIKRQAKVCRYCGRDIDRKKIDIAKSIKN